MFKILYKVLSIILAPITCLLVLYRCLLKKEDISRLNERFGCSKIARPEGKLIWFHVASVGELNSIIDLIKKIKSEINVNILLTSGTVTSAEIAKNKLSDIVIHQFTPLDIAPIIRNFVNHWKPDLGIFAESEIWPNLVIESAKVTPLILINARMSDKSFAKWKKFSSFAKNILANFAHIYSQSSDDLEKFIHFYPNAENVGNLKYATNLLGYNEDELKNLQEVFAGRFIFMAASTHKGEEEIVLKAHEEMKKHIPNLLTILSPRHPKRLDEVEKLLAGKNYSVRSKNTKKTAEIYIVDTIGEYGLFFRLSNIVLVGGSLVDGIGGHNILEPAKLERLVIFGQYMGNFKEIAKDFLYNKAGIMVRDEKELAKVVVENYRQLDHKMIEAAVNIINSKGGSLNILSKKIINLVR